MHGKIDIKMGEFQTTDKPVVMQSLGIGSCVVICLYDPIHKIGGLAHIMSPKSKMGKDAAPGRFADQAIPMMIEDIIKAGAEKKNLIAKIIGGASMFPNIVKMTSIGADNLIAVRHELKTNKIPIRAEDVGETYGRSVWFDVSNGDVVVSGLNSRTKVI